MRTKEEKIEALMKAYNGDNRELLRMILTRDQSPITVYMVSKDGETYTKPNGERISKAERKAEIEKYIQLTGMRPEIIRITAPTYPTP